MSFLWALFVYNECSFFIEGGRYVRHGLTSPGLKPQLFQFQTACCTERRARRHFFGCTVATKFEVCNHAVSIEQSSECPCLKCVSIRTFGWPWWSMHWYRVPHCKLYMRGNFEISIRNFCASQYNDVVDVECLCEDSEDWPDFYAAEWMITPDVRCLRYGQLLWTPWKANDYCN